MLPHPLHQLRPFNPGMVAGPVVHLGGGGQLAAGLQTGDQNRLQVSAGGIDGSGVAGRTGPQNNQAVVFWCVHGNLSLLVCKLQVVPVLFSDQHKKVISFLLKPR